MNPTSLDYLYQIAPPVPDRAPTTSRGDDDSTDFDNHLSQAASSVFDITRSLYRPSPPAYLPSSRSTSENDDSAPSDSVARLTTSKPSRKDKPTNDNGPQTDGPAANDKPRTASQDDDKRNDKRDQDQSVDPQAAAAAGAAQPAAQEAASSAGDRAKDGKQDAADQAKDKIAADELSKVPDPGTDTQAGTNTKATDKADEAAAGLKANIDVAEADQVSSTGTKDASASEKNEAPAKASKTAAHSAKANAASAVSDLTQDTIQDKQSNESTATSDTTTAASASATATAQALAEAKQSAAAQSDADPDSTTVGQTSSAHKDAENDNTQTDTPATTNAANVTSAIANITVLTPADAAVAEKPKQADDSAAKPVAAKADPTLGPLGRTLRTDLTGSGKTSSDGETSPVDVARFVSRVAKAVQTANDRDGVVQLRLSPPDLGSLKIQLTVKDGVMSAALEADNSNARKMLLDHLPALRDRLADQNIRVDRFDVDVKQENNGGQANPRGFNQNPYQQQAQDPDSRRSTVKTAQVSDTSTVETAVVAPRVSSTGINLVI